jgi:hypothetical protein
LSKIFFLFQFRKEQEKVLFEPRTFVKIPPNHYCEVQNPVLRNEKGDLVMDAFGMVEIQHGAVEIRLHSNTKPFPLYPGKKNFTFKGTGERPMPLFFGVRGHHSFFS